MVVASASCTRGQGRSVNKHASLGWCILRLKNEHNLRLRKAHTVSSYSRPSYSAINDCLSSSSQTIKEATTLIATADRYNRKQGSPRPSSAGIRTSGSCFDMWKPEDFNPRRCRFPGLRTSTPQPRARTWSPTAIPAQSKSRMSEGQGHNASKSTVVLHLGVHRSVDSTTHAPHGR